MGVTAGAVMRPLEVGFVLPHGHTWCDRGEDTFNHQRNHAAIFDQEFLM
jgi:hypothetical protein